MHEAALLTLDAPPVEHKLIGPRLLQQSRLCLDRVYTLATMYRLEGDTRFADRARTEMLTAASFPDWNPSHFLDTAEMTHALAIGYDWLHDYLDEEARATIRQAIIEKGLQPALACYKDRVRWVVYTYNWSQVCNGGIGIGALAIADEQPELAEYILSRALVSIRRPMETYAPDGGWDEGPGYWHYATRYNVYFLAALESALGTDFGLSRMPGFSRTGDFRVNFVGPVGHTFNYADATSHPGGGDEPGEGAAEMFWLARKFHNPLYAWHQHEYLDHPHALDLLWFDPRVSGPKATGMPLDALFRKTDVAFFRSAWEDGEAIFLGFKGGDSRASHSHLDLGSFVLDALGHRWAVDLGRDDYNLPGYFSDKRWTYYRMRTESHNTLLIDGENQDPAAKAPIHKFVSTPEHAFAIANLSEAYPMARRVLRGIGLLERRHVLVQDEVAADEAVDVLEMIHKLAARYADELSTHLSFESTTDRKAALQNADFVINTVYIKGHHHARAMRELTAKHGYYYGGVRLPDFYQLGLMLDVARDMEKICPDAWLIQSGNPVFDGCTLMTRETGIKVCGLCHGHYGYYDLAQTVGIEHPERITWQAPGLNHNIWLTDFIYEGKDAYPLIDEWINTKGEEYWRTHVATRTHDIQMSRGAVHEYRMYGLFPIGDTARRGGSWYHTDLETKKHWFGQPWGGPDTEVARPVYVENLQKRIAEMTQLTADPKASLVEAFGAKKTREQQVPIIDGLVNDNEGQFQVNVPNRGALEGVPEDVVVEVPAVVNKKGGGDDPPPSRLPEKLRRAQGLRTQVRAAGWQYMSMALRCW